MQREVHSNGIHLIYIPPQHWWQRAKWQLLQPYTSFDGLVTVPAGFITDGASVPWFIRWRFPPTGKYFGGAIIHDYILVKYKDWKRANHEFEQELIALNVSWFDRTVLIGTVKWWAWFTTEILHRGPKEIE